MVAVKTELPSDDAAPSTDAIPPRLRQRCGAPRQVFAMTLICALMLAVFASGDLTSWLNRMGDGQLLAPLQHAAAQWDGAMARLGLTRPHDALRLAIRRLLVAEW